MPVRRPVRCGASCARARPIAACMWVKGSAFQIGQLFWDAAASVDPDLRAREPPKSLFREPGEIANLWKRSGLRDVEQTFLEVRARPTKTSMISGSRSRPLAARSESTWRRPTPSDVQRFAKPAACGLETRSRRSSSALARVPRAGACNVSYGCWSVVRVSSPVSVSLLVVR
jgi:hypothetical protein